LADKRGLHTFVHDWRLFSSLHLLRLSLRLAHDPEKCAAVFPRDRRVAFARRSCANKNLERDDGSSQSHRALVVSDFANQLFFGWSDANQR
jgi:hypothetical protein